MSYEFIVKDSRFHTSDIQSYIKIEHGYNDNYFFIVESQNAEEKRCIVLEFSHDDIQALIKIPSSCIESVLEWL